MRLAGAALIDEDDVAVGLHATEELANAARHLRRALTGPTGEEEQRVGLRVVAKRGQDDDSKVDRAALTGVAVFEDFQRAAVGVGRALIPFAWMETVESGGCLARRAPERARHQERNDERFQVRTFYIRANREKGVGSIS